MSEAFEAEYQYCLPALKQWYAEEMAAFKVENAASSRPCVLFGCPVYGNAYVRTFLELGIASMLAPKNLPVVSEKWDIIFLIYTDAGSKEKIERAPEIAALKSLGIEFHVRIIPQVVLEVCTNLVDKYWILGCAHNLCVQFAKKVGAAYHMLVPDIVYSAEYFSNLFALTEKYDAVVHTNISAAKERIYPKLINYKKDLSLSLSAELLIGLGIEHMHKRSEDFMMNGHSITKESPGCICMNWLGKEKLHLYAPHFTLSYLSAKLLQNAPVRLFNTLDGDAPYFIPDDAQVYAPQAHDNMGVVEISSESFGAVSTRQSLNNFCVSFWIVTYLNKAYLRFFRLKNTFALPFYLKNASHAIEDAKIEEAMEAITDFIEEHYEESKLAIPKKFHLPFSKGENTYAVSSI